MSWILEKGNVLSPKQYGFRQARSTTDVLVRLDTDIKRALVQKKHVIAILFNLKKAYDTTGRGGILEKLHWANVRGPMAHFIGNFLNERVMKVRIGTTIGEPYEQCEGVPQRSVLSFTLFSFAISDISSCLPQYVDCTLYVNDFAIYPSSASLSVLKRRMQRTADRLMAWTRKRGFEFSTKSVVMHFTKIRGVFPAPTITLGTYTMRVVSESKFLGMLLDNRLSWIPRLKDLRVRCQRAMSILKCLSWTAWCADRLSLLRIYKALIQSKLDYGCQVYSSATKTTLRMLDSVHHQALRLCTGAFRSYPVESLYVDSGGPFLYVRRKKLSLQFYARLKSMPRTPTCIYQCLMKMRRWFRNRVYNTTRHLDTESED